MSMLSSWRRFLSVPVVVAAAAISAARVSGSPGAAAGTVPGPRATASMSSDSPPSLAATNDLPVIDLPKSGYVEEELLVSCTAHVYDWAPDGALSVRSSAAPY